MRRVYIICEGQTEENFIKEVFAPYFDPQIVTIQPLLVDKKGGALSYDRVKNFILRLVKYDVAAHVTTMFDYYALDTNFPGHNQLNEIPDIYKKVKYLEEKFRDDINSIFSNNRFFPNPEEINTSYDTSPSHRLGQILNLPKYRKVLHGATIAKNIGIDNIRQKCKHFDEWCNNKNLFP